MKTRFSDYIMDVMVNDHEPLGIIINDKIRVKEYVDGILPGNHLFDHRMYAGYDVDEALWEIHRNGLPCVVKINNSWHKQRFLFDGGDIIKRSELLEWQNTPWLGGEWAYQFIKPGFLVEKLLPKRHEQLKIFVFHGRVEFLWHSLYDISSKKIAGTTSTMYDRDWNLRDDCRWTHYLPGEFPRPKHLDKMIEISEKLSPPCWKFFRVDLYYNLAYDPDAILVSELQQYHAGGSNGFGDFDYVLGGLL